jgi:hypothetical protein
LNLQALAKIISMFQYCPSVAIKVGLTFDMFSNVIFSMDNGRNSDLYQKAQEGKVRYITFNIINNYVNLYKKFY